MSETLKIVIPMAGFGSRLRPHTWSRPKQLMTLADNSVLGHILNMFKTLPDPENVELIPIVGYLADKIEAYLGENYPELKTHFVLQSEMKGQSHAIYQARAHLNGGPMLMVFADTLVESDLGFLANEEAGCVAWVKAVEDPRRFGVAELGEDGLVKRLIEKPTTVENNLAVVGFYYFADSAALIEAIEQQMQRGTVLKGEYFLADAINIMLENGLKMRTEVVEVWLDAGVPASMLETNRYLLDHGSANTGADVGIAGMRVTPPVFLHPEAKVENSKIGPHVSIGPGVRITNSTIRNSIIEADARITASDLRDSLIGQRVKVKGAKGIINIGDDSVING